MSTLSPDYSCRSGLSRRAALAAAILVASSTLAIAQSPQEATEVSLCVYHDRSYSEGAAICAQRRFMLMCTADGGRLVWKAVTDRSLSERCVAPTLAGERTTLVRPLRRQRVARTAPPRASGASPKCFNFNNKQYCE